MSGNFDDCFHLVMDLVKECGKVVRETLKKSKNIETKSSEVDFVTETDRLVEEMLTQGISARFPDHRFIGEESVSSGAKCELTDSPTWVIDPIDGTMNFVHCNPNICISVALLVNKKAEIGIIYSPALEQMYWARAGQGAFLNGEQIHVSGQEDLSKALLVCEIGTHRIKERMACTIANLQLLIPQVHGIRSSGSCALNLATVAAGAADVYFECGIHAWDIAAGDIIVREAGGAVLDFQGGPFDLMSRRVLCASSRALAEKLASVLLPFPELPRD